MPSTPPARSRGALAALSAVDREVLLLHAWAGRLLTADGSIPAWRHDGALAYVRGANRQGSFRTTVEIRASAAAPATTWATGAGYEPLAWAGHTLIVARLHLGEAAPTILAYRGPGLARQLGHRIPLAISPDGRQLLIADGAALDGIPSSPELRLTARPATRRVRAEATASSSPPPQGWSS